MFDQFCCIKENFVYQLDEAFILGKISMLHYFVGKVDDMGGRRFLSNEVFGVEVHYLGSQTNGAFFLYPYWDDNRKTISYYAFDTVEQKNLFEEVLKVSGIGAKTAYQIVQFPEDEIRTAISSLDINFFQNLPGIGPKTAKKLLLELKDKVNTEDFEKLNVDEKLYKNIVSSLKNLGYETARVKAILQSYDGKISQENMGEIIKWVIGEM